MVLDKIAKFSGLKILAVSGMFLVTLAAILIYNDQHSIIFPGGEFCGISTNGKCSLDDECMHGGCSGEVCQSIYDEPVVTNCVYMDCYNETKYGLECKCVNQGCQWPK